MRRIGVVTVARSDYGIYLPLLRRIEADPDMELSLIVSGMHLSPDFGLSVKAIEEDGFEIGDRVEMLLSSDTPEGIAKSMGLGTLGFAQVFTRSRPDILVVLGDRFEMHAAALAALPFKIPVAHIHGGEVTQGAIDEALRHSLTKLSHLHFAATKDYARRLLQLGEESWRVIVSGAPSLDNLAAIELLDAGELEKKYGLRLDRAPLVVTFHPVTLEYEQSGYYIEELLAALSEVATPIVFTLPNADTGGRAIIEAIEKYVVQRDSASAVDNLGTQGYFSLMAVAEAMVGNSSSGIIEAASFNLPVVNIGTRQQGRVRGANVIDVGYSREEIAGGMAKATQPEFRDSLADLSNPYGCGKACDKIVKTLRNTSLDNTLLMKRFCDMPVPVDLEDPAQI